MVTTSQCSDFKEERESEKEMRQKEHAERVEQSRITVDIKGSNVIDKKDEKKLQNEASDSEVSTESLPSLDKLPSLHEAIDNSEFVPKAEQLPLIYEEPIEEESEPMVDCDDFEVVAPICVSSNNPTVVNLPNPFLNRA